MLLFLDCSYTILISKEKLTTIFFFDLSYGYFLIYCINGYLFYNKNANKLNKASNNFLNKILFFLFLKACNLLHGVKTLKKFCHNITIT